MQLSAHANQRHVCAHLFGRSGSWPGAGKTGLTCKSRSCALCSTEMITNQGSGRSACEDKAIGMQ